MRDITSHIVEGDTAPQLTIQAVDEPGAGGANHQYRITWNRAENGDETEGCNLAIGFQNGPIKEHGVNGVTETALLAILMDRLNSFQAGPYACEDNEMAEVHAAHMMDRLQNRTRARIARGVEGTSQK